MSLDRKTEELARLLETTLRLYDLQEAEELTGRKRQQWQRWVKHDPPQVFFFIDNSVRPWRYLVPGPQVAAVLRTPRNQTPPLVTPMTLPEARERQAKRRPDKVPPPTMPELLARKEQP